MTLQYSNIIFNSLHLLKGKYRLLIIIAFCHSVFLHFRFWFKAGVSNIRPAGQNRPVTRSNPARGMIS